MSAIAINHRSVDSEGRIEADPIGTIVKIERGILHYGRDQDGISKIPLAPFKHMDVLIGRSGSGPKNVVRLWNSGTKRGAQYQTVLTFPFETAKKAEEFVRKVILQDGIAAVFQTFKFVKIKDYGFTFGFETERRNIAGLNFESSLFRECLVTSFPPKRA